MFGVNQFAFTFLEQIIAALFDPAFVEHRAIADSRPDVIAFAVESAKHFTTSSRKANREKVNVLAGAQYARRGRGR
jgi:hypothetical protein